MQTTACSRGGQSPEVDRTNALQGVTKEKCTIQGRRGRRGGKRHEELAEALVDGTTCLDCKGVERFTPCFGLSGPISLFSEALTQMSFRQGSQVTTSVSWFVQATPLKATRSGRVSEKCIRPETSGAHVNPCRHRQILHVVEF